MKVIFLDIDGVLVTQASMQKSIESGKMLEECADQNCVKNLNRVIIETEAKIVISSSWKMAGVKKMIQHLDKWGVQGECIGITPDLWQYKRGTEIQRWLSTRDDIEIFTIIDDHNDMEDLIHRLVQTQFSVGFQEEHAKRCIQMLLEQVNSYL
jgi:hypothetical protein